MLEFIQHAENSRIRIVEKYCSQVGTESSHVLEVFLRGVCIVEILQLEVCVPASPSSRPLHCHRHDLPGRALHSHWSRYCALIGPDTVLSLVQILGSHWSRYWALIGVILLCWCPGLCHNNKHLNVTKVPFAFYALQCVVLA